MNIVLVALRNVRRNSLRSFFGPRKLPEFGKSLGRAMAEFKKVQREFQGSVQVEMKKPECPVVAGAIKPILKEPEQGDKILSARGGRRSCPAF